MLSIRVKLKFSHLQAMKEMTIWNQSTAAYSRHYQYPQYQLLSIGPKAQQLHISQFFPGNSVAERVQGTCLRAVLFSWTVPS